MQKFLVLYMAPLASMDAMMRDMNEEKAKKGMDEWSKWMADHKDMFADMGAPAGKNLRVTAQSASEVRNEINGYSIVHAESREAAAKMFEGMGHFDIPGAYVEVMPLVDMSQK